MNRVKNNSIQALILDMDGVLWRGQTPIGNLSKIYEKIRENEISVVLVTNNSTLTVDQYVKKLESYRFHVDRSSVITSSLATAQFLKKNFPQGGSVYVIGEVGVRLTLEEHGFHHSSENPLFVVVGMDRELTYDKLKKATLLIRSGIPFIATNSDRTFPVPEGLVPGAGAIVEALKAATDVNPTIIGKPSPIMFQVAVDQLETSVDNILVVGDRLETDIAGAQELGMKTALVLSGVTNSNQVEEWKPPPDFIARDLDHILELLFGD